MQLSLTSIFITVLLLAAWPVSSSVRAEGFVLIHPGATGSLYDVSAREFARRVNKRLPEDSPVLVRAVPDMGDTPILLDAVREEDASFALVSSAMISVSNRFAVFELPYLIQARYQVRGLRTALLTPFLQPEAKRQGFHILGVWENGFRHITNDLQSIAHPRDLSSVKIAVMNTGWREKVMKSLGAQPVSLEPDELAENLIDRKADGLEAPLAEIQARGLSQTQRHLTLSDHLYTPAFLVMNQEKLNNLPDELRVPLIEEARNMENWIQAKAVEIESNLLDQLDRTMQVVHADVVAFRAMGRKLYGEFIRSVPAGMKMIIAVQAITEEHTAAN